MEQTNYCMVCGVLNPLERCHVIPRRSLKAITDRASLIQGSNSLLIRKMISFAELNTIILCKNHHGLFDRHKLSTDEYDMIKPSVLEVMNVYGSAIYTMLTKSSTERAREFEEWWNTQSKMYGLMSMAEKLEYTKQHFTEE